MATYKQPPAFLVLMHDPRLGSRAPGETFNSEELTAAEGERFITDGSLAPIDCFGDRLDTPPPAAPFVERPVRAKAEPVAEKPAEPAKDA